MVLCFRLAYLRHQSGHFVACSRLHARVWPRRFPSPRPARHVGQRELVAKAIDQPRQEGIARTDQGLHRHFGRTYVEAEITAAKSKPFSSNDSATSVTP